VIAGAAVKVIVTANVFVMSVTEVAVITAVPEALPALRSLQLWFCLAIAPDHRSPRLPRNSLGDRSSAYNGDHSALGPAPSR